MPIPDIVDVHLNLASLKNRVATDRAEKNFLTFPEKFPDFSKSNS